MNITISDLLDLNHTLASDYLAQFLYPWEALDGIRDLILSLGASLSPEEYDQPQEHVCPQDCHRGAHCLPGRALYHRAGN